MAWLLGHHFLPCLAEVLAGIWNWAWSLRAPRPAGFNRGRAAVRELDNPAIRNEEVVDVGGRRERRRHARGGDHATERRRASQAMDLRRSVQSGPVAPRLARGLQTASELTLPTNAGCGIPYCCKPSK